MQQREGVALALASETGEDADAAARPAAVLSAGDHALVEALALAPEAPPALPRAAALFTLPARLHAGLKRHGVGRMARFAASLVAEEGLVAALRVARLSRAERRQRQAERRRSQHAAAGVELRFGDLELRESPEPVDPFETAIFAPWPTGTSSQVPLTGYQHYALSRLRYPGRLDTDADRRAGLMWYIETYSPFRRPFKAPFSGAQIDWLLESEADATGELRPRIVAFFLASHEAAFQERATAWSPARVAYWWCLQKAPELNIEHALIPEQFLSLLSSPLEDGADPAPLTELLIQHGEAHADFEPDLHSPGGRLAAYATLLMRADGLHQALFFPAGVVERIARLASALPQGSEVRFDREALQARALAALAHRERARAILASPADLSAARLGQDWAQAMAAGAAEGPAEAAAASRRLASPLPFPVRVIGPLNSRSGLGQASRLSISALRAVGVEVETVDFLLDNPAPRGRDFANTYDLSPGYGVNLLHLSGESLPLAAAFLDPAFFSNKTNIGYFFWELPTPAECHELSLRQLDEIWVSSQFNHDVYAPVFDGPVQRMGMALEPLVNDAPDRRALRHAHGLPQDAFVFVTTFDALSFMGRKNPAGVLRAFRRAFPLGSENVRLVVKTHNLMRTLGEVRGDALRGEMIKLCRSDPRVVLINETLDHADLLALKSSCDAYISLHRSEGWGFGMLESMQLGLPVIATGFSGNVDFCDDETGWLVDYKPTPLRKDEYIFVRPEDYWAEPDIDSAAAAMRAAAQAPETAAAKGAVGRARVIARYSPEVIGRRYLERLTQIGAGAL